MNTNSIQINTTVETRTYCISNIDFIHKELLYDVIIFISRYGVVFYKFVGNDVFIMMHFLKYQNINGTLMSLPMM